MPIDEKSRSTSNFFNNKGRCQDDCLIIIFGGSGDLAKRKLFPALGNLMFKKMLPKNFRVIAVGRKPMEPKQLLSMGKYPADFIEHFVYLQTDYSPEGIRKLKETCDKVCQESGIPPNYLFYLAIPPNGYAEVASALKKGGMVYGIKDPHWCRLVVEKPYGRDIESATELNENLLSCFAEKQIYRIDHYLGKEAVQNLLVFRFANSVFEPLWNHHYIEHVQISSSEMLGAEDRAEYYDQSGLLRDMIQNHLMQIFCLVTMEPPVSMSADAIRDEKVKVLRSLRPLDLSTEPPVVVRGQYGPGQMKGEAVKGYRDEKGVKPDTSTETFVALRMNIDNFRWAGVPFYLRSGKRSGRDLQEDAQAPVQHQEHAGQEQPHRLQDPAPGSHPSGADRQESRTELRAVRHLDELLLQRPFRHQRRRVRTPAYGCGHGRSHLVRPFRRDRIVVEIHGSAHQELGGQSDGQEFPELRGGNRRAGGSRQDHRSRGRTRGVAGLLQVRQRLRAGAPGPGEDLIGNAGLAWRSTSSR
jgi:glucose-6-phosphate 1-dehydrogenase